MLSGWLDISCPPSLEICWYKMRDDWEQGQCKLLYADVIVEGPVTRPPIDHAPDYLAKGVIIQVDIPNWLAHITITSDFGIHCLPGPSAPCCQRYLCSNKGGSMVFLMCGSLCGAREHACKEGRLRVLSLCLKLIMLLCQEVSRWLAHMTVTLESGVWPPLYVLLHI